MLAGYYHLQYPIYLVALHRYLKRRLAGYSYDKHMGGVFYLFVRGIDGSASSRDGVYSARPPRQLIEALSDYFQTGDAL